MTSKRIFKALFTTAMLAGVVLCAYWAFTKFADLDGNKEQSQRNYVFVVRTTAKLEFDGIPIDVNETVGCGEYYAENSAFSSSRILLPSHNPFVSVPGTSGYIEISLGQSACRLFKDKWFVRKTDQPILTVPEGYIPNMEWFFVAPNLQYETWKQLKGPARATTIRYRSAKGLKRQNSRLKIIEPFQILFESAESTPELLEKVESGRGFRESLKEYRPSAGDRSDINTLAETPPGMLIIPEADWRNPYGRVHKDVADEWKKYRPIDLELLPRQVAKIDSNLDAIVWLGYRSEVFKVPEGPDSLKSPSVLILLGRQGIGHPFGYVGRLPQPELERYGMLVSESTASRFGGGLFGALVYSPLDTSDEVITFDCIEGEYIPQFDAFGEMKNFAPKCNDQTHFTIRVPGRRIIHPIDSNGVQGIRIGGTRVIDGVYYDTRTKALWIVSHLFK